MMFFGINGIIVSRVTRIQNRFLRNRFVEKLEQLVDLSDNSYKRSLEYLFYGVDPNLPSEIHRAMEEGFRTP
jgi:alpha-mannosidase